MHQNPRSAPAGRERDETREPGEVEGVRPAAAVRAHLTREEKEKKKKI